MPGFPNFLSMASPYAWVGLSWFNTVEYQMKHMERLFGEMQQRGARTFEVTEEANARFLERMTTLMKDSAFELGNCVDLAVLLVQEPHRQGRSAAVPSDIGAQRREGAGPIPDVGLRDSLTAGQSLANR